MHPAPAISIHTRPRPARLLVGQALLPVPVCPWRYQPGQPRVSVLPGRLPHPPLRGEMRRYQANELA
jgi:hypothetical protein